MRLGVGFILMLGVSAACSDEKKKEVATPGPLSLSELCVIHESYFGEQYHGITVGMSSLCYEYTRITPLAMTDAELFSVCRPGTGGWVWAEQLMAAVNAGSVAIDWPTAHTCVDQSRALRTQNPPRALLGALSGQWQALRDGACTTFYHGNRNLGDSCSEDWECPDGAGCYTLTPWQAGSEHCMRPGVSNEPCPGAGQWRPCGSAYACISDTCVALVANNGPCGTDDDCASGYCDPGSTTCKPPPQPKALHAACASADECASDCVTCRKASVVSPTTCEVLGGEGAYCRDWNDCVLDLGCTNSACTTVGQGMTCFGATQNVCGTGLGCVPSVDCSALDETACGAQSDCIYDTNNFACVPVAGTCQVLPTSGPCLFGYVCDSGSSVCLPSGQCAAFARSTESCDDAAVTAPPCGDRLACVAGRCLAVCDLDADCGSGQFCDFNVDPPACTAYQTNACTSSAECPGGLYCASCDTLLLPTACAADNRCSWQDSSTCESATGCDAAENQASCTTNTACKWTVPCNFEPSCGAATDPTACAALTGCAWDATATSCGPACFMHDNDATGCAAVPSGCVYDATLGYCDPNCSTFDGNPTACDQPQYGCVSDAAAGFCEDQVDCAQFDSNPSGCWGATTCAYFLDGTCDTNAGSVFQCLPQAAVGNACGADEICTSSFCAIDQLVDCAQHNGNASACAAEAACIYESSASVCVSKPRCAEAPTGCEQTASYLREAFLFGGVWFGLRRRRRKAQAA